MYKLILFLILSFNLLNAQKIVKKTILNHKIAAIDIDTKNCFKINIKTSNTDELVVQAIIDGEYKQNLMLNLVEEGVNVHVSTGFTPSFIPPNDKLSAHKVVSISLEISVPQYHNIQVNGTNCNVYATGSYKFLKISLNDGICTLTNVSEKVMVTTQSGDINITAANAQIMATSKYGKIQKNTITKGNNYFSLNTTTGNINLWQSE